ncbi:GNAT family N-acetyltransferase [Phyllobacterium sp. BT25]|uniref:GNAT family N-acetyltransferase n=1 Tax=Phyllobacterium pellucidum TaxID=2740464 RepID=A0A849VLH3_9HYPH|nr:GNAT family N-acetyltransferase [Phyllobacterium pellucidum]NTS30662.1 GNAT family N-acetyltransferase [Phyllobacterium pellucidum]
MIRRATMADKFRVLLLAKNFHEASGLPIPFNPPYASILFDQFLTAPEKICIVLDRDGVQGVLAAQVGFLPIAPVRAATEVIWWIEPEYRGRDALHMLAAYEAWAEEQGCSFVNMVGLGSDPLPAKFYERRGYIAAERHFMKPIAS